MTNMSKRVEPIESFWIEYSKTSKNYSNNHYKQVHLERHQYEYHIGYSKDDDLNEQVMSPNKIKAPTFNGHHKPWIFNRWISDMVNFFYCYNLFDNRRIRIAKIKLIERA